MWSRIFNNQKLKNAGNLKLKLKEERNKFDFEKIHSDVFDSRSGLPEHEVKIFKEVVNEAYVYMDDVIQSGWDSLNIHDSDIRSFLNRFTTNASACFTLNQDMTMEKRFGWNPLVPGSANHYGNWGLNFDSDKKLILPTNESLDPFKTNPGNTNYYIKLHGSLGWITTDSEDSMVIGINKPELINKIPLLKWYFELFEQAISAGDVKLLIIGYGFRDDHINKLLAKACEDSGLRLFVVSPGDVESFLGNLLYRNQGIARSADEVGNKIWKGVEGYFPYKFSQVFPRNQRSINPELVEICSSLEIATVV